MNPPTFPASVLAAQTARLYAELDPGQIALITDRMTSHFAALQPLLMAIRTPTQADRKFLRDLAWLADHPGVRV